MLSFTSMGRTTLTALPSLGWPRYRSARRRTERSQAQSCERRISRTVAWPQCPALMLKVTHSHSFPDFLHVSGQIHWFIIVFPMFLAMVYRIILPFSGIPQKVSCSEIPIFGNDFRGPAIISSRCLISQMGSGTEPLLELVQGGMRSAVAKASLCLLSGQHWKEWNQRKFQPKLRCSSSNQQRLGI